MSLFFSTFLLFNSTIFYSDKHYLSTIYKQTINQIDQEFQSKLNLMFLI